MTTAIVNIGDSHDGGPDGDTIPGDAIVCDGDAITWIGDTAEVTAADHRTIVDAAGATVVPGWIDSHVHTTFGDYTPRQQTIGFLESYLHGGMTRAISASEVHVPGRPKDVVGIKALAIAAQRCFQDYRPSGVTVHGGSVILEPGLTREDFRELREAGVWMAKGGFGAFDGPEGYAPVVRDATAEGILVMCHTGGGSIPGSMSKIGADALLMMRPRVAGHVNGGPTALARSELEQLVSQAPEMALQIVQAGNLRSAIEVCELALEADGFHRVLIATDTPTGTGVIPLGMMRQMAELTSLGPLTSRQAVSAATGNVGTVYGLDAGRIERGRPADLLVIDAPVGGQSDDALGALEIGDLPAVAVAITQGVVRFEKSRNTPTASRAITVSSSPTS